MKKLKNLTLKKLEISPTLYYLAPAIATTPRVRGTYLFSRFADKSAVPINL
jgi:hypothetical protein